MDKRKRKRQLVKYYKNVINGYRLVKNSEYMPSQKSMIIEIQRIKKWLKSGRRLSRESQNCKRRSLYNNRIYYIA